MNTTKRFRRPRERGAVSVEAALLIPVFVLVAALGTAGWRIWWTGTQVQAAAESAARAASQAGTTTQANLLISQVVAADLATAGVHCSQLTTQADVSAVAAVAGNTGTVTVTVTCTVGMNDLLVPGLPGSVTVRGDASEAIDPFARR